MSAFDPKRTSLPHTFTSCEAAKPLAYHVDGKELENGRIGNRLTASPMGLKSRQIVRSVLSPKSGNHCLVATTAGLRWTTR